MAYPYICVSNLAKKESWRKEINRPIYHIHKWWAQRLGSVFRANIIHALGTNSGNEWDQFYKRHSYGSVVLDPFMGSGTTLGEALKLGCNVIGCDINPVSSFLVREELRHVDLRAVEQEYRRLDSTVGKQIRSYHHTIAPNGERMDVLYYFWVMTVSTPSGEVVPLFRNYVVSKNAYPSKKPEIQVLCPCCGDVFESTYSSHQATCPVCDTTFDPWDGPAKGSKVVDSGGVEYKISNLLDRNEPPAERLYALLAVDSNGSKHYLKATQYDFDLYAKAEEDLNSGKYLSPLGSIEPGYNADQPRSYGFTQWKDLYNARELLSLGILLDGILAIEDQGIRRQLLCLFNGAAEFNNKFCSYKGEGTGAIRPIFSNHILKPERTHCENSVWGFEKSSGCFSTLYRSRYLKAKRYLDEPFELSVSSGNKPICSDPISPIFVDSYKDADNLTRNWALILNGDSSSLPIPDKTVDAVVTDPPYFDFVHYSELSDFFYSWLKAAEDGSPLFSERNSRRQGEVQQSDYREFSTMLGKVFLECARVMKDDAVLMFSFHHSRNEGWDAVANAISSSGLYVSEVYPVYAELSASTPKAAAKEPISIDMLIVCNKLGYGRKGDSASALTSERCIEDLTQEGIKLSANDLFVIRSGFNLLKN